ncbi:MAG: hypothetical protein IT364_24515 [Candidatus Hydrogenedentes bacterium]|nr:hypothetical protein [Candidatus Hydrogenedentota bacterium]
MSASGVIRKIAFAADGTAPPSPTPAAGGLTTWSSFTAFTTLGAIEQGDIADLDEDSIEVTPREEGIDIDPPLAQNREDEILFKNGADSFGFACYSVDENVYALSSTAQKSENEVEEGTAITYRAAIIEVTGKGYEYYPKVRVKVTGSPGGIKELRKVQFECKVFGTSSIPSGRKWIGFNGA